MTAEHSQRLKMCKTLVAQQRTNARLNLHGPWPGIEPWVTLERGGRFTHSLPCNAAAWPVLTLPFLYITYILICVNALTCTIFAFFYLIRKSPSLINSFAILYLPVLRHHGVFSVWLSFNIGKFTEVQWVGEAYYWSRRACTKPLPPHSFLNTKTKRIRLIFVLNNR